MTGDDLPIGRVLSRREALALLAVAGVAGVGLGTGRARGQPARVCVVRPEQTEGPFFVDERLERSDIRPDPTTGEVQPGAPLSLTLNVSALRGGACTPLPGARVDVWHCDALGHYSDVGEASGRKFLRGFQLTDAAGVARFTTIYPGWYPGRAVHIHFKVRTAGGGGRDREFVSQLYFDDDLTDRVHATDPYARRGPSRVRNERDGLFRRGGRQLLLAVTPAGPGYTATFDLALSS